MSHIHVIGRFPPPYDGQAIATRRVADLISREFDVHRSDVEPTEETVRRESPISWTTLKKNLALRRSLRRRLAADPTAIVVWPSVSSSTAGHLRDRVITLPAFGPNQRVLAVVHRGNFHELFRRAVTRASAVHMTHRIACFVFLTDQLANRCEPWIPAAKRTVIPNTIDEVMIPSDEAVAGKQASRETRERLNMLFVANMIPSKGYLDVLRAAAILRDKGHSIETHFAGQWMSEADRAAFEHEVDRLGVRPTIVHHGRITDRAEIRRLYERADIFLLPSYYENEAQPLSIIEALSAGTPIVTTRHAGIPDMVTNKEAEFAHPRDPESIADAVARMLPFEKWHDKSNSARGRFMNAYAPNHVATMWSELLNSLDLPSS